MKQRIITGSMLVLLLVAFLLLQVVYAQVFDLFIGLVSVLGAIEFSNILTKMGRPNFKLVSIIYAVSVCLFNILFVTLGFTAIFLFITNVALMAVLYLFTFVLSISLYRQDLNQDAFRTSLDMNVNRFAFFKTNNTLYSMMYPTFILSFMYLINHIGTIGFTKITTTFSGVNIGIFGIVLVFAIASMSDTLAYIFGSMIRGPKLCPKISPNKTISGAVFGLVGGMIGAVVVYFIFYGIYPAVFAPAQFWKFLFVGLFGSAISQVGDIFESYLKRRAGVKDSSNMLPGHGGVLDRVDATIFNTLFVFMCLLFIFA